MISKLPFAQQTKEIKTKRNIIIYELGCSSVNPWQSNPNRYWDKDSGKFLKLASDAIKEHALLVLVNTTKKKNVDQVRLIDVRAVNAGGILHYRTAELTRKGYDDWFKKAQKKYTIV